MFQKSVCARGLGSEGRCFSEFSSTRISCQLLNGLPGLRALDSAGLIQGWGLGSCFANKLPWDTDAMGSEDPKPPTPRPAPPTPAYCTLSTVSLPTSGPPQAHTPPLQGQPAGGTCLEFVEQKLQDLWGGHGAVDADVGDGAVGRREH